MLCGLIGLLPYVWLLTVPLYGSFCGTETVLRLSLLLYFHAAVTSVVEKLGLSLAEPVVQVMVLLGLISLPVTLVPYPVIWLYSKLLWFSEPLWLAVEVLAVVRLIITLTRYLTNRIDEEPTIAKAAILGISFLSYAVVVWECWLLLSNTSSIQKWVLLLAVCVCMVLHIAMWTVDPGVISEAAMLSVVIVTFVYVMIQEAYDAVHPVKPPKDWGSFSSDTSFLRLLFSMAHTSMESASSSVQFLQKLFSPFFVVATLLRLYIIMNASIIIGDWLQEDQELIQEERDNSSQKTLRSSFLTRCALTFVYTQTVVYHIQSIAATSGAESGSLSLLGFAWLKDILPGRVMQIVLTGIVYLHYLHRIDNSDWDD